MYTGNGNALQCFWSDARNVQCHKFSITNNGNVMRYFPKFKRKVYIAKIEKYKVFDYDDALV